MKGETNSCPYREEHKEAAYNHFAGMKNIRIENRILTSESRQRFKRRKKGAQHNCAKYEYNCRYFSHAGGYLFF
jgi:hypothetical protein